MELTRERNNEIDDGNSVVAARISASSTCKVLLITVIVKLPPSNCLKSANIFSPVDVTFDADKLTARSVVFVVVVGALRLIIAPDGCCMTHDVTRMSTTAVALFTPEGNIDMMS